MLCRVVVCCVALRCVIMRCAVVCCVELWCDVLFRAVPCCATLIYYLFLCCRASLYVICFALLLYDMPCFVVLRCGL